MAKLVSIIMPAYNADKYISETIESVISQTYKNWELIIVDDESQDNTATIIKQYQSQDSRIKYYWQKNGRQGKARNHGIKESKGEYLAFIDADDVWRPYKIANQLLLMKKEEIDLVFGYSYLIEDTIKTNNKIGRGNGKYSGKSAVDFLLLKDAFIMSTVLVKKSFVLQVDNFTEKLEIQYCEDWHLWLKLAFEGCTFYSNSEVVSYYRLSSSSICATESDPKIKLCNALLDLNLRYPDNIDLIQETEKRIRGVIYHSTFFEKQFVSSALDFMDKKSQKKIFSGLLRFLDSVNIYLFRKAFFFIWG
jgi:glycosyltransferase involved in cell wall biosynthesis